MKQYSDSTVSDFLNSVTDDQSIGFLNSWNETRNHREKIYISYDSTNKNCQAGDIEMVEFGHPKVDVGQPVFNYAVAFASYVNSKLNENGMNPVTEKELLENRIDFNEHKIPHVEFVEFPEEMRSQYLLYAFPTMLKMAYEYCFITFGEKYLKNPIAMNIRDFLIKYDYKKDTE